MTIVSRQVSAAVLSVFLTATVSLLVERAAIRRQGIEATRESMRLTLLSAESTKTAISRMRQRGTFDDAKLASAMGTGNFRNTAFYETVPVVAAWRSIAEVAAVQGYQFRVPANRARNQANEPTPAEAAILRAVEMDKAGEYFAVDESRGEIVFARAIRLTEDCLICHGQPGTSPTGDGKDALGYRMEGWRAGEMHGAFVLRTNMDKVDAAVRESVAQVSLWLIPITLVLGALAYWLSQWSYRRLTAGLTGVSTGAARVLTTARRIADSSSALADGVTRQVERLQTTGAASLALRSATDRNNQNSEQAVLLTEQSDQRVTEAQATLRRMQEAMDGIGSSSEKIRKIIQVIDGLAFQTNILALNAAVEAARAGTAGQGFAVVADEVRSLAQRSASAAHDTSELIEESIARATSGSAQLIQVKSAFNSMAKEFHEIREAVSEVRDGGTSQLHQIRAILSAVNALEAIANESSGHAEEGAAVSALLSKEAIELESTVARLTKMAR